MMNRIKFLDVIKQLIQDLIGLDSDLQDLQDSAVRDIRGCFHPIDCDNPISVYGEERADGSIRKTVSLLYDTSPFIVDSYGRLSLKNYDEYPYYTYDISVKFLGGHEFNEFFRKNYDFVTTGSWNLTSAIFRIPVIRDFSYAAREGNELYFKPPEDYSLYIGNNRISWIYTDYQSDFRFTFSDFSDESEYDYIYGNIANAADVFNFNATNDWVPPPPSPPNPPYTP